MSLASANTTSPVVDSIYTRPSTSLAAAASGIHAILQRAHSMGYQHGSQHFKSDDPADQGGHRDRCARERTHSPVRANSKRRRSVASISRPEKGVRHARYASCGIDPRQIELFPVDHQIASLVIVLHGRCLSSWDRITIQTIHPESSPAHAANLGRHQAIGAHHEAELGDAKIQFIIATLDKIMTVKMIREVIFPGHDSINLLKCQLQGENTTHHPQIRMTRRTAGRRMSRKGYFGCITTKSRRDSAP